MTLYKREVCLRSSQKARKTKARVYNVTITVASKSEHNTVRIVRFTPPVIRLARRKIKSECLFSSSVVRQIVDVADDGVLRLAVRVWQRYSTKRKASINRKAKANTNRT